MTETEARELVRQGAKQELERHNFPDEYVYFVKELIEDEDGVFIFHVAAAPEGTDPEKLCSYEESEDEDGPREYYGGDLVAINKDTGEVFCGVKYQ